MCVELIQRSVRVRTEPLSGTCWEYFAEVSSELGRGEAARTGAPPGLK